MGSDPMMQNAQWPSRTGRIKAGVLEDGIVTVSDRGTGQGSVISPLLANIYLHYVLDLWAERWRRREAAGDMIIVRYADDFIVGFEHESDARRFWNEMRERLQEFALSLHPEKTRLIEFGRIAADNCKRHGFGKPETFTFLGFTFICSKTRRGKFLIKRKSRRDRMRAKLLAIKQELQRRMHQPIPQQGKWLKQVVTGYFNYHAVPTNGPTLTAFLFHVTNLWRPRHQSLAAHAAAAEPEGLDDMGADQAFGRRLAPATANSSSLASAALRRQTPEVGAVCPNWARTDLCGGREVTRVPTAINFCSL
jgi:RNA-directed DNA polymerase